METSITKGELSDGSYAYNVEFDDGLHKVVIAALDEKHAQRIKEALLESAAYVGVY